ncbi:DUF1707 and FHA domain-containing protein [Streptomyces sp. NPDC005805]|uniref:DUF1707 and FHA domain-containing protein n=1 Tax=Streptomyces sp. NPDC005805 TaxID=3157068 RepID=UPI0033FBF372
MTSSYELPSYPARVSDAERERALDVLREGAAQGRLSHDTFVHRMGLVLAARVPEELAAVTADLTPEGGLSRRLFGFVGRMSAFSVRMRRAWQAEKLPPLLLPEPGPNPLRIGRDPANGLRLSHDSVSRLHAELSRQGRLWILRDLGSTNGTTVNGRRLTGSIVVQDGDMVGFGSMLFRLTAR